MKKLKKIILLVLLCILMPTLVNADCGLIIYDNYNVVVSNENGAYSYESNYNKQTKKTEYSKTKNYIPYGKEVKVYRDETKFGDDYFLTVIYEEEEYIVKASDLKNIKDFNANIKLEKSEYYVYKDVELRSGPGVLYDVVGTIKAHTNIYFEAPELGEYFDKASWVYVSDGTISGYMRHDPCSDIVNFGTKVNNNNLYYISKEEHTSGLKYGDKINAVYIIYNAEEDYYVNINGSYELIPSYKIGEKTNNHILFISFDTDNDRYEFYKLSELQKNLKIDDYLKIGKSYDILYTRDDEYSSYYYISIDDEIYIVKYNEWGDVSKYDYMYIEHEKEETIKFKEDMYYGFNTYESYNIMKKGETIRAYKLLNESQKEVYYNSELGFFYKISESDITIDNNEQDRINSEAKDEVIVVDGLSAKDYVIICLCGTIALSVITIIVIVLINKKKKSNENINTNININN